MQPAVTSAGCATFSGSGAATHYLEPLGPVPTAELVREPRWKWWISWSPRPMSWQRVGVIGGSENQWASSVPAWRVGGVALFALSAVLLTSVGGLGIVAAPVTLPALYLVVSRHPSRQLRGSDRIAGCRPGGSTHATAPVPGICRVPPTVTETVVADSGGRRNTSRRRLCDMTNKHQRQQAIRAMRGKMWSPGRPSTARREDRVRFWEAIGRGLSTDDAAEAGMSSAVGARWFREAGGMPPLTLAPVSGRYLSFAEREEIADPARPAARCPGDRSPHAACAVDGLTRAAPQRVDPEQRVGLPGDDRRNGTPSGGPVARRSPSSPPTTAFGTMCRTASPARSPDRTASWCTAPKCASSADVTAAGPIDDGRSHGALSRFRTGSRSISPMMRPCGSRTRPSTRRSTSKAAVR